MTTQTEQRSLSIRPGESQTPSSRQKDLARSSSGTGLPQHRGEFPFSVTPYDLFHTNPFSLMRRMTEEMDRIFQGVGLEQEGNDGIGWWPAIEVAQTDGKYNVRAELPGLSPNDVKVDVVNDALVIQGERKVEQEENQKGVRRTERQYGCFYRSIPLPEGADVEHANAKFQNGMLEIAIPVPQQKEDRRSIPIEGGTKSQAGSQSQAA
jgi:HSP20 family protein